MALLRCTRAGSARHLQPSVSSQCAPFLIKSTFSTTTTSKQHHVGQETRARRSNVLLPTPSRPQRHAPALVGTRQESSSATSSQTPTSTPPNSTSSESIAPERDILTWNRFFDLRRKRRYVNLGSSVLGAVGSVAVFGPILAQQDIDGWAAKVSGLEPVIVFGITSIALIGIGWLSGPSFGSAMFKVWAARKGWDRGIAEKEKSFFARIKRYRADPSSSSPQNPIPDYYGEKIGSVKDYRRWLKDQRAFNLKKNKNMI